MDAPEDYENIMTAREMIMAIGKNMAMEDFFITIMAVSAQMIGEMSETQEIVDFNKHKFCQTIDRYFNRKQRKNQ